MVLSLLFGFFLGVFAIIAVEGVILLFAIKRLRREKRMPASEQTGPQEGRILNGGRSLPLPNNKKGIVWVLENVPKISTRESPPSVPREQKNKDIVEVLPVKKYARIEGHSLILSDVDGSQAAIELRNCTILAVSASNLSSRKWAKRYPIILESKTSVVYNGSKTCYLYLDTSWEKESWCKELRLVSGPDKEKSIWYAQLSEAFNNYLASLNSEYPSFLKPSALFGEVTERANRADGSSSKVRLFLKRFAKKPSKTNIESKPSSVSSTHHGESQPSSPPSNYLGNNGDPVGNENFINDEGTLCWNLLFSRLFFDAKSSTRLNNAIQERIQKTLSSMRTPSYIGGVICTGIDLGNLPPYIHKMRVLPIDLNEAWAIEVDIEYSGGILLDFETRIGVCEPELQEDIMKTSLEQSSAGELTSDLLEGIEHYGNQLKSSSNSANRMESRVEGDKVDILKQSKSSSWASTYVSRWKAIKQSFADQVSQVPLSLAVRVASLRGTLRLHIKPPPSDQIWYGFTSMPEIDWNLESSIGDRKITNAHIALLIGNRFKSAIREALVLPNCESICIPFMLAEKDDWVPRKAAPYMWVNHEATDTEEADSSNSHREASKLKLDCSSVSRADSTVADLGGTEETVKSVIHIQEQPKGEPLPESWRQSSQGSSTSEELRVPLLSGSESRGESSRSSTSGPGVTLEEPSALPSEEDLRQKKGGRRARMIDLGKKMGEKLEEKRRNIEEKGSRFIAENAKKLEGLKHSASSKHG